MNRDSASQKAPLMSPSPTSSSLLYSSTSEHVAIATRGSCLEIHLNRPDKKNAITGAMYAAMADAMTAAASAPAVRSILFAGNGASFCSGNDLQDFLSAPPKDQNSPVLRFLDCIAGTPKVMIAAIHGHCVGIGATLLLHCDHVVADPTASLQFSFVKMALVPEAGSSLLLPRAVGRLKAAELLLLGDPVPASEALNLGLVSRVVGEGDQLNTARAFAARLDALAPEAVAATRRLLNAGSETVAARMAEEIEAFQRRLASSEFREAVAAFMQKRPPNFAKT
jgi:enoyl-CoA hydratase/carnithine racemase